MQGTLSIELPGATPTPAAEERLDFRIHREILELNLARQIEAIRASDTKIVLLVPTTTAMIGVLAAMLRGVDLSALSALYLGLTTLPILIAYFFMGLTLIPRMRHTTERSLLFFGGISSREAADYRAEITGLTAEAYLADLADQCHATASIARVKYRHVRDAYVAFFAALPFWALAIYLLSHPV